MLTSPRTSLMPRACPKPQGPAVLDLMVGLASALPFASAAAQTAPAAHPDGSPADVPGSETITVKGQRTSTELAKLPAQVSVFFKA